MAPNFQKIFTPFNLKKLNLRNRIVMAAMGNNFSYEDGTVSERAIAYYRERAKGGAGLIITEACAVDPKGRHRYHSLCAYDDLHLPGLRRLVESIHKEGAAIALQLHHAGALAIPEGKKGNPFPLSDMIRTYSSKLPNEMSLHEIQMVIAQFGKAARRAKESGFDAIEIHGGHGYLIHQFLSRRTNRRIDEYGGTSSKRLRFALEVLKSVREAVGDFFPIIFRISGKEFVEDGYSIEEVQDWAKELERNGVSAFHVSGGTNECLIGSVHVVPPMSLPEGYHVPLASSIKKVVNVPVIAVGRIHRSTLAEQILSEGHADLIATGRAFLSDPYWILKAKKGEEDRIRPCVSCNHCIWTLFQQKDLTCFQNASLGYERDCEIHPLQKPRRIVVIGGGLAGMEAARVARKCGHQVTLFEKESRLGGQALLASVPPHKKTLEKTVRWLAQELEIEGVDIRLNSEVNVKHIEEQKPDIVILATGARPISFYNSLTSNNILTAWQVLSGIETGKRVIVIGGGMVGVETAEFLTQKGCEVKIVEMRKELATDMEGTTRALLIERLKASTISIMLETRVEEIYDGKVLVTQGDQKEWLEGDTIVLAMGSVPNNSLLSDLKGRVPRLISVGDCVTPRRMKEAIHEGFWAGFRLSEKPSS